MLEVWRYVHGVMRAGGLATLLRCLPAGAVSIMSFITVFMAKFFDVVVAFPALFIDEITIAGRATCTIDTDPDLLRLALPYTTEPSTWATSVFC